MNRRFGFLAMLALGALLAAGAPARPVGAQMTGVEPRFAAHYQDHNGVRLLGYPLTGLLEVEGYPAQYFDKGRIEDHRGDRVDPAWSLMFGRLTAELIAGAPAGASVSGTSLTYGALREAALPAGRSAPPAGFRGGVLEVTRPVIGRAVFIPVDPALRPAPGYYVPWSFWIFMNRADLFPGGWLHDLGLPLSPPLKAWTTKGTARREVVLQAFERTVLTYDPLNPRGWEAERANLGADALQTLGAPAAHRIGFPELGANVAMPLHIHARVGAPGQQVVARLRWADGTEAAHQFTLLRGIDGGGLLLGNLEWGGPGALPATTQGAVLEIRNQGGTLLARRGVTVLSLEDPAARNALVYWTVEGGEQTVARMRRVVTDPGRPRPPQWWALSQTERLAWGALDELLWGPPADGSGLGTAIPTPAEVLAYPGRGPDWGERVALQGVTIANGVATASFSPELRAYGGGSLRVRLIREQITQTLKQFPEVSEVRITIYGQSEGVLEP